MQYQKHCQNTAKFSIPIERGMQKVRTRLDRIQDQLITPSTSMVGVEPKQLIEPEYHDYLNSNQDRVQTIHEHAMYDDRYDLTEKQLRVDTILLR